MRYLLDTNAVIALLNDDTSKPAQRAMRETPGEMAVSAIVHLASVNIHANIPA